MSVKITDLETSTSPSSNTFFLAVDVDSNPNLSVVVPLSSINKPNGSNNQLQYSKNGVFTSNSNLKWDETNSALNSSGYGLLSNGIITNSSNNLTLLDSHNGKVLYLTSGTNITLNTAPMLGIGFSCLVIQANTGTIRIVQGANTTVQSYSNYANTSGIYATASIFSPAANTFLLMGNLT